MDRQSQVRAAAADESVGEVAKVLVSDFQLLSSRMKSSARRGTYTAKDATHARSLLRALFALIEGTTHAVKVMTMNYHPLLSTKPLPPGALEVVFEERYDVDDKGRIVTRPMKITLESNLKFAFRFCAETLGVQNPLRTDAVWWQALKRCNRRRDYLMHPRTAEDLHLDFATIADAMAAEKGFGETLHVLLDEMERVRMRDDRGITPG
jgi:hypothetical protein